MKHIAKIIACLMLLVSCKTTQSEISANIYPQKNTTSLFIGQLEAFLQKKPLSPVANTICIEASPTNKAIKKTEFEKRVLFETKLIFSMWLKASDRYNESTWSYLNFKVQDKCEASDLSNLAFISIKTTPFKIKAAKEFFEHPPMLKYVFKITRTKENVSYTSTSLASGSDIGGFAQTGEIASFYNKKSKVLEKVERRIATGIRLNHNYEWQTLEQVLSAIDSADSLKALKLYNEIFSQSNPSLSDFYKLGDLMNALKLRPLKATGIVQKISELKRQKLGSASKYDDLGSLEESDSIDYDGPFTRSQSLFYTMLHEVGHLFGLKHSHDTTGEPEDSIKSPLTKQKINGVWFTEKAALSHNFEILYLTEDDIAGAKASAQRAYETIKANIFHP